MQMRNEPFGSPIRVNQSLRVSTATDEQNWRKFDFSRQNLQRIELSAIDVNSNVLIFDHNEIVRLEHLENLPNLFKLSIIHNRLVDVRILSRLRFLQRLNLSHNRIDSIDACRTLEHLTMLNISHNNVSTLSPLNHCRSLESLDASFNLIRNIDDLSQLTSLKYFNLQKNHIASILLITRHWPKSLHTVDISDNEIQDLTEIACLSTFIDLKNLYIADNPCLMVVDERNGCQPMFDYRPYVLNWCLSIENLDGNYVTRKETLKAEWLFSQGKGRSFRSGEHVELTRYLIKVCGTNPSEKDEIHLSRVMLQQEYYQETPRSEVLSVHTPRSPQPNSPMQTPRETPRSEILSIHTPRSPQPNSPMRTPRETSSRYSDYENRPMKPLDQEFLRETLNEYPANNIETSPPRTKPLVYNANRYSPKATSRGPTPSSTFHVRSVRTPIRYSNPRVRRNSRTIKSAPLRAVPVQLDSSVDVLNSTPRAAVDQSVDFQQLTNSVETIRNSMLQAYLELQERFTRTTELQASALNALRLKYENDHSNHQRELEEVFRQNRLLHDRVRELEKRLDEKQSDSNNHVIHSCSSLNQPKINQQIEPSTLSPPLRVHISKRDTRSFFVHWIPNPMNENRQILGYRIFVDDRLIGTIDSGRFEAIIDSIRDEGEYRIKIRTYDENMESPDSNIVVARFRRQNSSEQNRNEDPLVHEFDPDPSNDELVNSNRRENQTPIVLEKNPQEATRSETNSENRRSPIKTGIMSRLTKSPYRINRNVLIQHLTSDATDSSTTDDNRT